MTTRYFVVGVILAPGMSKLSVLISLSSVDDAGIVWTISIGAGSPTKKSCAVRSCEASTLTKTRRSASRPATIGMSLVAGMPSAMSGRLTAW